MWLCTDDAQFRWPCTHTALRMYECKPEHAGCHAVTHASHAPLEHAEMTLLTVKGVNFQLKLIVYRQTEEAGKSSFVPAWVQGSVSVFAESVCFWCLLLCVCVMGGRCGPAKVDEFDLFVHTHTHTHTLASR